ncbi:MAG: hypothetical protein EOM40_01335 [Clostridia bacterium]|nr:hypothetical protein [Clostridia bacterium]NCC42712.1 hypothetical protein [Clostridia bacterium]
MDDTKREEMNEDSSEEMSKLVLAAQIAVCAAYVLFLFLSEAKALHKSTAKVRDVQAKEKIRYEKLKYKVKRKKLKKEKLKSNRGKVWQKEKD